MLNSVTMDILTPWVSIYMDILTPWVSISIVSWQPEFVNYYPRGANSCEWTEKQTLPSATAEVSRSCNAEVDATMQGGYMTLLRFNALLHPKCNQARDISKGGLRVNVLLEYFKLADCSIRVFGPSQGFIRMLSY